MISATTIKARLKKQAVASEKTMQEVLLMYGLERTIYRLSVSDYMEQFVLKGGVFMYALFNGDFARVTSDIDLLARNLSNRADDMKNVFKKIFSIECDDALRYDIDSMDVKAITEFKEYHGLTFSKQEIPHF